MRELSNDVLLLKVQKMTAWRAYMVTVLWTGWGKIGPVWTSQKRCENSTSSCFSWRKVWTGVKCNFSSAHHQDKKYDREVSIIQVRMWNFTRIGCKTKKLWLSISPALRRCYQPGLGQPPKGVNRHFSSPHLDKSYVVRKLSISET